MTTITTTLDKIEPGDRLQTGDRFLTVARLRENGPDLIVEFKGRNPGMWSMPTDTEVTAKRGPRASEADIAELRDTLVGVGEAPDDRRAATLITMMLGRNPSRHAVRSMLDRIDDGSYFGDC